MIATWGRSVGPVRMSGGRAVARRGSSVVVVVVAAAFLAGWVAGRRAPTGSTLVVGAVAAAGAVAAWVPVRVVIWIARDEHRGLVSGSDPVLRAGPLLANLALAAVVGAVAARLAARPAPDPDHA